MAPRRYLLQTLLEELLGTENVYFQPSSNVTMDFPCITYERDDVENIYADNNPYRHTKRYLVTAIDRNPDSEIHEKIAKLPSCTFSRHFVADGLHHDAFNLYF